MRIFQLLCVASTKYVAVALSFLCMVLLYVAVCENNLISSIRQAIQVVSTEKSKLTTSARDQEKMTETIPSMQSYNLMEEQYGKRWMEQERFLPALGNCTIENANAEKLQQDHPCVIRLIQNDFLRQPSPRNVPYNLDNWQKKKDPSDGQSQAILRILRNQTNGFFIESGANDGEFLSNTLYMERYLNWTGLLVEPDKNAYDRLIKRNRKAYTLNGCVSTKSHPMKVLINVTDSPLSYIVEEVGAKNETNVQLEGPLKDQNKSDPSKLSSRVIEVQCFPLYSILLAIGRTQVDFFSLDVEGAEYKLLSTIPWHKVDITALTVERNDYSEGEPTMTRLMERNKFVKFGFIELDYSRDVVYVKDFLADFRYIY